MSEPTTFVKLDRNILNWGWFQNAKTLQLFLYLILKANVEPHEFMGKTIKRGQLVTSVKNLEESTGMTTKSVRVALEHLKSTGEVAIRNCGKYSIITVLSYDKYQDKGNQRANRRAIKGQSKGNNIRSKECKELKERDGVPAMPESISEKLEKGWVDF